MNECVKSCYLISRICIILINILFMIFGLVIMVIGVVIKVDKDMILRAVQEYVKKLASKDISLDFVDGTLSGMSVPLIVLGVIIMLISILGCLSGCIPNRGLLIMFAIFVSLILIFLIISTILLFGGYMTSRLRSEMEAVIQSVYVGSLYLIESKIPSLSIVKPNNDTTGSTLFVDFIQYKFKCCGLNNVTDYNSATKWNKNVVVTGTPSKNTLALPAGCCANLDPLVKTTLLECLFTPTTANSFIDTPCWPKIESEFNKYMGAGIAICSILIFLTLALFCMTLYIFCTALDQEPQTSRWGDSNKAKRDPRSRKPDMYIPGYEPRENQYDPHRQYNNNKNGFASGHHPNPSQAGSIHSSAFTPDWYSPDRNFNNPRVIPTIPQPAPHNHSFR